MCYSRLALTKMREMLVQWTVCSSCSAANSVSINEDSKETVLSVLRLCVCVCVCVERHRLFWFKCLVNALRDLKIFTRVD